MLLGAGTLILVELTAPCPPGGPIDLGACAGLRPLSTGVVGVAAVLYVAGLTAVRAWVAGLQRRRLADPRAARDWYLLAAVLGIPIALMLAFISISALR